MKYVASVSFGKDSTAMLLTILEKGLPLDVVVYFNSGVEFEGSYKTRDKIVPILKEKGIEFVELHPKKPFLYMMLDYEYDGPDGKHHKGYGFCGGKRRGFTREQIGAISKYMKTLGDDCIQYVGLAYDERERAERKENKVAGKRFPLIDYKMTEADCLQFCYDRGIDFDGVYKYMDRLSCGCCGNKNLKELKQYYLHMPQYGNQLVEFEKKLGRPMKGKKYLPERLEEGKKHGF